MASREKSDELPKVGECWYDLDDYMVAFVEHVENTAFGTMIYSLFTREGELDGEGRTSVDNFSRHYKKLTGKELAFFLLKKENNEKTS